MRTTVGDGEDFAVKIGSDQKGKSIDLDGDQVTSSDIVGFQYGNPFLLFMSFIIGSLSKVARASKC